MRKNTLNFVLDLASSLLILVLAGTGLIMEFVLPPGSGGNTLWGIGRHAWGDVHFWVAVALIAALIVHLALHWSWTVCTVRRLNPWRRGRVQRGSHDAAWGLGLLAAVIFALAALVAVARTQVVAAPPGTEDEHATSTASSRPGLAVADPGRRRPSAGSARA